MQKLSYAGVDFWPKMAKYTIFSLKFHVALINIWANDRTEKNTKTEERNQEKKSRKK